MTGSRTSPIDSCCSKAFDDMDGYQKMLAKFRTFDQMYSYENRLKTFSDWPFREDCRCTPEQMAKAGFVHCPGENEPDVACCFCCLRELEGWEPQDDPWKEHVKRTPDCPFLNSTTSDTEMTVGDYVNFTKQRLCYFLRKMVHIRMAYFREKMERGQQNMNEMSF